MHAWFLRVPNEVSRTRDVHWPVGLPQIILNFSPNKNVLLSNHIYDIISISGSSISIDLQIKNQQTLMEENHAWKKNKLLNFIFMMRILVFLVKRQPFHHESKPVCFLGQETTIPPWKPVCSWQKCDLHAEFQIDKPLSACTWCMEWKKAKAQIEQSKAKLQDRSVSGSGCKCNVGSLRIYG